MTIYVKKLNGDLVQLPINSCGPSGKSLMEWIIDTDKLPKSEVVLYHNGLLVQEGDQLKENGVYHISVRLRGGKGGFGSMLRMIGAQIEKTTNHEACRDLSGRRMRDVNNEKKLADWISTKSDREREREEKRLAKLERLRAEPRHHFVDPKYDKQNSQVRESLNEAISQGIAASSSVDEPSTSSNKRKTDSQPTVGSKKSRLWVGIEGESDSDNESDVEASENPVPHSETTEQRKSPENGNEGQEVGRCDTEDGQKPTATANIDNDDSCEGLTEPQRESRGNLEQEASENPVPHSETTEQRNSPENGNEGQDVGRCDTEDGQKPTATANIDDEDSCEGLTEPQRESGGNLEQRESNTRVNMSEDEMSASQPALETIDHQQTKTVSYQKLEDIETLEELEILGLDWLKKELLSRGLKCGGTLQERAKRLFSVKGLEAHQIDPALKAKPAKGKKKLKSEK